MTLPLRLVLALAITLGSVSTASAQWVEASSRHFLVYSEESPQEVREFTEKLEMFDRAVRTARRMGDPERSPAVKLVVFRVKDVGAVNRVADTSGIAGFYIPRVEGPISVVPRTTGRGRDQGMDPDVVLFHEYAHHLQLADLNQPVPHWLTEGFAEFFSTARIMKDGALRLGERAEHRRMNFQYGAYLPMETMLAGEAKGDQVGTVYALGWGLTHYLTFAPERKGQLAAYMADLAKGVKPLAAAQKNFGNLLSLNRDVEAYIRKPALPVVDMQSHLFNDIKVNVRPLNQGEAEILPWRMESKVGVDEKEARRVVAGVRQVSARFPSEPLVLATLAEAELDDKNYAAAQAAADRLLAVRPQNVEGLIYKGRALAELGKAEKDAAKKDALFRAARSSFIAANRIDKEDPEPLAYFYRTYEMQGIAPTNNARTAIHYASDLMPQDPGVRMLSVVQYLRDNKLAEARQAMIPLRSGHGGGSKTTKEMAEKLDAGDGKAAVAIYEKAKAEAEAKEKKGE